MEPYLVPNPGERFFVTRPKLDGAFTAIEANNGYVHPPPWCICSHYCSSRARENAFLCAVDIILDKS